LQAMARDHLPVVIADVREDERWIWVPGTEDIRAWIGVPLLVRDEMIGALMIDSTQSDFYTEADATITQALANQAAVAIENARLYQAEQRGREIAEALQETARVVNTSLNLEEVLPLILEQLAQVIHYDSSAVLLLDDDRFEVTAGRGFPDMKGALRISFSADGDNISSAVIRARRPLVIEDIQDDPRWQPIPATAHIHGWIGAPLIVRDRVIGLLNVDSRRPGAYSEEDGQLVFAFAAQAATAIENARLYEQAQRRLESLTSLSRASRAITGSLDVKDVLEQIVGLAGTVVNSDHISVVLLDEEGQPVLGAGDFLAHPVAHPVTQRIRSSGVTRHVLDSGQPVVVDDISTEGAMSPPLRRPDGELMGVNPDIVAAGICSFAAMPIQARGRMLGVLFVHSRQPRAFHGQLPLLTTFANQVAIAIENARLFEAEQRRRQEAETLRETALALTTSLDRNQVIERILIKLREVVPYDSASVQLLWDDHLEIIGGHGFPNLEELVGVTFDLTDGDNPNREVMRTRAPFILEDAPAVYSEFGREPHAQAAICSWLGVPMLVGDQPVGMIALDRHEPGFYTQEHARLAEAFAAQAAIAIENARLYEEAKRHLDEAMLIQEVMLATASTLDFALAFERTVKALHRVLGIDRIGFLLPSEQDDWLARHPSLVGLMESAIQIPIEGSLVGQAYRTGQPVLVQDVTRESAYLAQAPEVRSELAVPVWSGDRVVAVLRAESPQVGAFSEDELRLFITVAGQLGVALDKARLYRELRNHAEQLEQRVQERTAQLQAQYARQDAVLRSASDGIVVTDARGAILQTNPVAQAWLAQTLSPDDAAWLHEAVRDVAQRAEEQPETVLELTGLDLELRAAPILEPGTDEAATVVAIHDVSHLKTLDRMKSRFISNVSHELRTPVTTIKLYTALLQQASPEKWGKYLETMEREVEQLACLVEDILQISHIDAGWMEIKPRPTSINELTETATVRHLALAQNQGLTLEHRPAEPGPVALVDPEQTMHVLNNLVMNAIQYTPEGGRLVVSTGKQEANGRVWTTVAVADTGIGIPEEELPRIFDRFFRGEEPRLMQVPGTGLGLAIAKSVVGLHGGRLTVESQVGEGTTFTVWLPLA
ncbi:MAG: GAF domain-containing protein, partial [Anaerolineae bacterium]